MEFTDIQLDALCEIGNIGMGNAATALSVMLNSAVSMTIPSVKLIDKQETQAMTDELFKDYYAIVLSLTAGIGGYIVHFMKRSFAEKVINFFFAATINEISDIDEMGKSIIGEVGNITSASYVNAIASFTGVTIDISTPSECTDLISQTNYFDKDGKKLIYIDTSFYIENDEIKSNLFFMPDEDAVKKLLKAINI